MAGARGIDANALAKALRIFAGVRWPVAVDDVPDLVASLGWTIVPGTGGRSLQAQTGRTSHRTPAELTSDKLGLATVSFDITDDVPDASTWGGRLLRESFTDAAAIVATELGAPSGRFGGSTPQAWWDLPGGSRVEVGVGATAVTVGVYSAEYAEEIRTLAAPDPSGSSG
ncbi:DUF6301 family protein [uncultured Jatrophihabitans sp.]|uniref:DUF6301 family protein n=1 Tax=uncultured Jatrophihabitans sp. TaxID=1610747 RepID=UPI0035CA0DF8